MKWIYNNKPLLHVPTGKYGFIYKITQISTGMIYVGKKNFYKNDSKVYESDWKTYKTSSKILKPLIQRDQNDFIGDILDFATTAKQLTYLEIKYMILNNTMEIDSYNGNIGGKIFRKDIQ